MIRKQSWCSHCSVAVVLCYPSVLTPFPLEQGQAPAEAVGVTTVGSAASLNFRSCPPSALACCGSRAGTALVSLACLGTGRESSQN